MPFTSPVVAGVQLVRNAIQSQNFVTGVAGWRIARDGSAEFNNGTFRGNVIVGPTSSAHVTIDGNLPAPLQSAYGLVLGTISDFSILMYPNGTDYWYQIVGTNAAPVAGTDVWVCGWVRQGVVKEFFRVVDSGATFASNFLLGHSPFGDNTSVDFTFGLAHAAALDTFHFIKGNTTIDSGGTWQCASPATFTGGLGVTGGGTVDTLIATSDSRFNSTSLGRGIIDAVNVTTIGNLAGPASAETDIPNLALSGPVVLGRAYDILGSIPLAASVPGDSYVIRVRSGTALTGPIVGESDGPGTGVGVGQLAVEYFPAASGSVSLFISFLRRTGGGTFTAMGSNAAGSSRAIASLRDVSAASVWRST